MKALGVIPARWASTRLPGKVLIDIAGKPLIQHVWERAKKARRLADVIIACDEPHVVDRARAFGAHAVLTAKDHPSGSDRVAEAARKSDADIIVNIQGDEPLIAPKLIDGLVDALAKDGAAAVATAVKRIAGEEEFRNPNVVKVVIDQKGNALYFSRASIPFKRDGKPSDFSKYFRHLGIYAYRRDFLFSYCQWPKSFLEQEECLEQLRVLEAGYRIKCVETDVETIGVDTPEDVIRVASYLEANANI
jgi:3-deoxy-manno-octulosonate cytidylyltransferase (CMP-KDO synthetase)